VQLAEVSVFLFLIAPSLIFSFLFVKQGNLGFVLTAVFTILRDLALVCLILYFVWRNGEPVVRIGWIRQNWLQEAVLGLFLFAPLFYGAAIVESGLSHVGFSSPKTPLPSLVPGKGLTHFALAFALVAIVALAEETIFRGYLILRLSATTGSPLAAVLLSAAIFSFGHGYEGSAGVVTVGLMGLAFALVYVWRQSLVAPIVMHFLQDFVVILLIPLLHAR
jgi:membrane protease YdiL (CAAX protease family)